jgi:hypothetical protein
MKLNGILSGLAVLIPMAAATQAAQFATGADALAWEFSGAANPAIPTSTSNPAGGTGSMSITGGTYFFGTRDNGNYGSESGLWAVTSGSLQLTFNPESTTPGLTYLGYTLQIRQYISPTGFPYDGTIGSIAGLNKTSSVTVDSSVPNGGSWVLDTYSWATPFSTALTLNLVSGSGNGLLVDSIAFTAVPEPIYYQSLAGACLLIGGLWTRNRRKA